MLDFVKRWLGDIDMSLLDQLWHLPIEKGQKQGPDVRAVDIGISHQNDAVIAQFFRFVFIFANAGSERGYQSGNGFAGNEFLETGLFHIEYFAAQGKNCLKFPVTPLLGRSAGGISFDEVKLGKCRVFFLAVCQFSRQAHPIKQTFTTRHFTGPPSSIARARSLDNLAGDHFGVRRTFGKEFSKPLGNNLFDGRTRFGRNQLHFCLGGKLRIRHFDR